MENRQSLWWYNLLHDLRQSTNESSLHVKLTQAFADREGAGETWNYENILIAILTSNDLLLRINLLAFFQEHAKVLLTGGASDWRAGGGKGYDRIAKVYGSLTGIVSAPDANDFLRGQVLVSLTTIFINADVVTKQTNLVEALVTNLLDIVDNSGKNVAHRLLRDTACQCLQELEIAAPSLLVTQVPRLLVYAQNESTHAASSYIMLLTRSLQHACVRVQQGTVAENVVFPGMDGGPIVHREMGQSVMSGSTGGRSAGPIENADSNFFVPPLSQLTKIDWREVSTDWTGSRGFARDTMRCISLAIENTHLMTPHALLLVARDIMPFAGSGSSSSGSGGDSGGWCQMPSTTFRDHFFPLVFTNDILLCHTVLVLQSLFAEQFTVKDQNETLHRLVMLLAGAHLPLSHRLLAGMWLSEGACDRADNITVHSQYKDVYPSIFDPLSLKETKLRVLFEFLSSPEAPRLAPRHYLEILTCVNDFRYSSPASPVTRVYFEALYLMAITFPLLTDLIHDILARLVIQSPKFHPCVVSLITKITASSPQSLLPVRLMKSLNDELCALSPIRLARHFPLVAGVMRQADVDPCDLLRLLLRYLQAVNPRTGQAVHLQGRWNAGNEVLHIVRTAILHHPTPTIFHDVSNLLRFMSQYYSDLEIRDRAEFYLLLIAHVPGAALAKILSGPELHESSGGLARMVTPKVVKDRGPLRATVPQFISMTRVRDSSEIAQELERRSELSCVSNSDVEVATSSSTTGTSSGAEVGEGKGGSTSTPSTTTTTAATATTTTTTATTTTTTTTTTTGGSSQGRDERMSIQSLPGLGEGMIASYRELLASSPDTRVTLHFTLSYVTKAEAAKIAEVATSQLLTRSPIKSPAQRPMATPKGTPPYVTLSLGHSPFPDKVFGLTLTFSTHEPYAAIAPVTIPYLEQASHVNGEDGIDEFPYSYLVEVQVVPMAPVPANLDVSLYFNDSDGKTCRGEVAQLRVNFDDLLTAPPVLSSFSPDPQMTPLQWFDQLWEALLVPGFAPDPSLFGCETVRVIPDCAFRADDIVQRVFGRFVLASVVNDTGDTVTHSIYVCLPPKQHLLLRLTSRTEHDDTASRDTIAATSASTTSGGNGDIDRTVTVTARTDDARILPHLDEFFDEVFLQL